MNVLLLHNPTAGNDGLDADGLRRMFRAAGHAVDYRETDDRECARAARGGHDLIAVAGGDGTVADVLRALSREAVPRDALSRDAKPRDMPPLAIVPLGTANNLARTLGITGSTEAIVGGLGAGRDVAIDVGVVDGRRGRETFFESVGLGIIAHALGPVNAKRLPSDHKIPHGLAALLESLDTMSAEPVRCAVDGVQDEVAVLLLEVMKVAAIGPQLRLAPAAHPGNGCLHVVTASARQRTALVDWIADPDRRGPAPVSVRTGRRIELAWQRLDSHVDDAFHAAPSEPEHLTVSLEAGAIRIRVPR